MTHSRKPRTRRRVVRLSDSSDYDRLADRPVFRFAFSDDGEQIVRLDTTGADCDDSAMDEQFYREQQPPHYGGQ